MSLRQHTLTFEFVIPGKPIELPYLFKERNTWKGNSVQIKTTIEVDGNLTKAHIEKAREDAKTKFDAQVAAIYQAQAAMAADIEGGITTAGEEE